jgi:putative exosortase-associated protein (TIGR04073 family)
MFRSKPDSISQKRILRYIATYAVVLGILSIPALSQAVEYTAARKAGRGLAAMTTCFLEVPGNMVAQSREHGPGMGIPVGFAIGLGKIVARVLVGTFEFLTAPFEVPAGFKPIIEPEFPWSYFDESSTSSSSN